MIDVYHGRAGILMVTWQNLVSACAEHADFERFVMSAYTIYIEGGCYSAILNIPRGHKTWSLQHFKPKPRTPEDTPNIERLQNYMIHGGAIGYDDTDNIVSLSLCDAHGYYTLSGFTWPEANSSGTWSLKPTWNAQIPTSGTYKVYPSQE